MLCAIPAARALRHACPEAHIALAGLPWAASLAIRFPRYFDDFLALPGFPGLHDADFTGLDRAIGEIRSRRFDVCLQLHGSGAVSNRVACTLGAAAVVGFLVDGNPAPGPGWFFPYPSHEHEIRRCLRLLDHLGIASAGEHLEFPIRGADQAELRRFASGLDHYICVHPGARVPARRWHPESFARVASALARSGWEIVLTGGPGDFERNESVGRMMTAPYRNLAGPMSAGALAALIAGARLLIANDTGVSHLAAAVGTPSVIVFTAADPARWAPLDSRLHRVVLAEVDCRPCEHSVCPIGHVCADRVTPDMVLAPALQFLSEEASRAA